MKKLKTLENELPRNTTCRGIFVPVESMKAYGRVELFPYILDLGTRCR